jgi:hypothetical protein
MGHEGGVDEPSWMMVCCLSISFMLFRISIDFIQTASQKTTKDYTEDHHNAIAPNNQDEKSKNKKEATTTQGDTTTTTNKNNNNTTTDYGSITQTANDNAETNADGADLDLEQEKAILLPSSSSNNGKYTTSHPPGRNSFVDSNKPATWSFLVQCLFVLLLIVSNLTHVERVLPVSLMWTSAVVVAFGALLTYRDIDRERFGIVSRVFYLAAALTIAIPMSICYYKHRQSTVSGDELVVNVMSLYALLSLGESFFVALPRARTVEERASVGHRRKKRLSAAAISTLLKPYFWPESTAESATMNRIRAVMTWVCVILSKVCNLGSPILVRRTIESVLRERLSVTFQSHSFLYFQSLDGPLRHWHIKTICDVCIFP